MNRLWWGRIAAHFSLGGFVVLLALAAIYGGFLSRHVNAYAGGSDSSGYLNQARLLRAGSLHLEIRPLSDDAPSDPLIVSPLGFKCAPDRKRIVPTYPVGLSLWLALGSSLFGWNDGPGVIMVCFGVLGMVLTGVAGLAFGLSEVWAIVAAVVVAASPLYLAMALLAMSDVPALVFATAAMLAVVRGGDSQIRRHGVWCAMAGVLFSIGVLIRPTNSILLFAVIAGLGFRLERWLWFGLGSLPALLFLGCYNHSLYGSCFSTGYGDPQLNVRWFPVTMVNYIHWLPLLLTPVIFGGLALGLKAVFFDRKTRMLVAWIVSFAAFYSFYPNTHEFWWYLRFLLPCSPALVIAGLLGMRRILLHSRLGASLFRFDVAITRDREAGGSPRFYRGRQVLNGVAVAGACAFVLVNAVFWSNRLSAMGIAHDERTYVQTAGWLKQHVPANAVLATMQYSGAAMFYTDFPIVRWDRMEPTEFTKMKKTLRATKRPLFAVLFPFEIAEQHAFERHLPGKWMEVGRIHDVSVWKCDAGP